MFLEIAKELGWEQVEEGIMVFKSTKKYKNYFRIKFCPSKGADNFNIIDDRIDEAFVKMFFAAWCCNTYVDEKTVNWVIPMLIADYYFHQDDFEKEALWAKKAMEVNKDLKPEQFSKQIRETLFNI